ncbi:MAG TPA: ferritin family protein [Tepidisphaeraceae bacterium]|nr:ferritin family protein [Tepidisphaeraceae bacterium]
MRTFDSLSECELLALAIWQEEEDGRVYQEFAQELKENYPATAEVFLKMKQEEESHQRRLTELYHKKFGPHIPLIRRQDVRGFLRHKPVWLTRSLGLEKIRSEAELMEVETERYYRKAAQRAADPDVKQLLNQLADEEGKHVVTAEQLEKEKLTPSVRQDEDTARRKLFLLQVVQPGLAGLMDGSVSTLAPLFAAAFATHNTSATFRVGLAASIGAGISMAFAEGLSDDGSLTGRGRPALRGFTCGLMTACGGLGHTLPYLIHNFNRATEAAVAVVVVELGVIAWIRKRFMDTPLLSAAFQVCVGGALVFIAGILIGQS